MNTLLKVIVGLCLVGALIAVILFAVAAAAVTGKLLPAVLFLVLIVILVMWSD